MNSQTKSNAVRSVIVIIGALAFGYLTFQVGFKPFLVKAEEQQRQLEQQAILQESNKKEEESF